MTPLKEALDVLMKRLGLANRAAGFRAVELWAEVAGPQIARRTAPSRVVGDVLHVDVESPVWASQLTLMKQDLVDRLNARAGGVCVRDIRFRSRSLRKAGAEPDPVVDDVRVFLRKVRPDEGDAEAAQAIAEAVAVAGSDAGAMHGRGPSLRALMARLVLAHRRLGRARSLAGWVRCPGCGRMYERKTAHCPRCGPGAGC